MKIENKYSERVIERGEGYLSSVRHCIKINNSIFGKVQGSTIYKTEVDLDSLEGDCSCPYSINCKHAVALYLTYQKGKFWDADDFIKSLNKMSSNQLKEMILSKLQENPDWIIKHSIRKGTNTKDFIKSFKRNFSSDKINEAEALLPNFSFEQLLELQDYVDKSYDELAEKLGEELENGGYGYDYWDDEGYDEELSDLNKELVELIVKKSLEKNKINEVIKRESLREEMIKNAESFSHFKEKIKKVFSKEECLEFLLNLKKPNVPEIKNYVDKTNKRRLYDFINKKPGLIKSLAKVMKDQTLIFSVGVYEKDFNSIIKNFSKFGNALQEDYQIITRLGDVVDLVIKNKFKDEGIAKKLLTRHIGARYDKKQISYLSSQINDFYFIKKSFNKEHIEKDVVLLERLAQIDKRKALEFINENRSLIQRHWSDVVILFNFLKKTYDKRIIKKYIEKNQDSFKTSSHLKKHLKDIGIFISQRGGILFVEIS